MFFLSSNKFLVNDEHRAVMSAPPDPARVAMAEKIVTTSVRRRNDNASAEWWNDETKINSNHGGCHGFIRGSAPATKTWNYFVCVLGTQYKTEEGKAYLNWLINDSFFRGVFLSRNVESCIANCAVVLDPNVQSNTIIIVCQMLRHVWEYGERIRLWKKLVDNGVEPNFAFALTLSITMNSSYNSSSSGSIDVYPWRDSHSSFDGFSFTASSFAALITCHSYITKSPYIVDSQYQFTHVTYAPTIQTEKEKERVLGEILINFAKSFGMSEKKSINPFTKAEKWFKDKERKKTHKTLTSSFEELVPIILAFQEEFFKELREFLAAEKLTFYTNIPEEAKKNAA